MFSDIYLNQKNYFGIEKRLPFKAFWDNGGQCYLDLKVVDGKIIALCGQLINYTNTSIVNAAEEVYRSIIDYLISMLILLRINNNVHQQILFNMISAYLRNMR